MPRGKGLAGGWEEISSHGWDELLARCLITFFAFIPFFAFKEQERLLGGGKIKNDHERKMLMKSKNIPMVTGRPAVIVIMILALFSSGCLFGPKFKTPVVPTEEKWREVTSTKFTGEPVDKIEWWKVYNDPILDSLIQQALRQNLTLQGAALRIVQARIARSASVELMFPWPTGGASFTHADFSTNVKPEVEIKSNRNLRRTGPIIDPLREEIRSEIRNSLPTIDVTPELDIYDAGFDAIWELDLWGKKRQLVNAASNQLGAAYASYDDVMVSLAAEVARTYVNIRTLNQRLSAVRSLWGTMNQFVKITEERFNKKEALITDVKLAQLLAGIVESWIPPLETALRQQQNTLCVLLGKAPQSLDADIGTTGTIPTAPPQAAVGIPGDLLRRRPDVRLAERLAAAQCARLGRAKAEIMPSFSIFGSIGLRSTESNKFFKDDSVRSAYGGLVNLNGLTFYPFTVENVRLQDAQYEEALVAYQQTVLNANREVEDNMYAFLKALDETAILEDNVQAARETVALTEAAYKAGKVIVSVPLVALTFLASQEDQMWQWRGETSTDFIAIYKALGGGWQNRTGQELVPENIRERMKKQADWWTFTGKYDLRTMQDKNMERKP